MDNPGRSKLANSIIESIRNAKNKKTNLADPIIEAIKSAVGTTPGRNMAVGPNNNRRNVAVGPNNNRRNVAVGPNNNRRNVAVGPNNNRRNVRNYFPSKYEVQNFKIPRNRTYDNNRTFRHRASPIYYDNNGTFRRQASPIYYDNNGTFRRQASPRNYENLFENNQTPRRNYDFTSQKTPRNNLVNVQNSGLSIMNHKRKMPIFDNVRNTPNTTTLHPGVGLKVLKNVLTETPKRYLKKVIKKDASARKAKQLLPKKKKTLVQFLQKEIRPKKRKSSAQILI